MSKKLFLVVIMGALMAACSKDTNSYTDNVDCSKVNADQNTYTKSVKSIIDGSCAYSGCHDSVTAAEGINLSTYAKAKREFVSGDALCTIYHDCQPMPQGSDKLEQTVIDQLTCWVKNGAPE